MNRPQTFIYRVENPDGVGPYRFISIFPFLQAHNEDSEKYPCTWEDKGIKRRIEPDEICGFKDKEQLRDWFCIEELQAMRKEGFNIRRIPAMITAIGRRQVLAKRLDNKAVLS